MDKEFMLKMLSIRLEKLKADKQRILYETTCTYRVKRSNIRKEIGIINILIHMLGFVDNKFIINDEDLIAAFMKLVEPRRR